jgi:LysR family hydrogen peroxide-inducible transcriptional activator
VAVADLLSFRKAAERCHVSQPSLSAQLALLERTLGIKLFERDRKRVLVTSAGKAVVERARGLLVNADDLLAASAELGDPLAGNLRIGVIPTVSPYLLPSVTPALRKAFPRLSVQWVEDKTDVLVQRLEEGSLDAGLLALEAELGALEHEVLAEDPFLLAAPVGHPLAESKAPASPRELKTTEVLLLDDGHCLRDQALAFCSRAKAHELEFRATSLPTLAQMVADGAGVTLLPRLAVPTETRRAPLKIRPFVDPAPFRTIALVWRRSTPLRPSLKKVADTLRDAFPEARNP